MSRVSSLHLYGKLIRVTPSQTVTGVVQTVTQTSPQLLRRPHFRISPFIPQKFATNGSSSVTESVTLADEFFLSIIPSSEISLYGRLLAVACGHYLFRFAIFSPLNKDTYPLDYKWQHPCLEPRQIEQATVAEKQCGKNSAVIGNLWHANLDMELKGSPIVDTESKTPRTLALLGLVALQRFTKASKLSAC